MRDKIAIIYTTFLRDELMKKTIQSIIDNWQDNYILFIGDQGNSSDEKLKFYSDLINKYPQKIFVNYFDYDIGLSAGRNRLIENATKMGIKYCLVTADSIKFTDKYDFQPMIDLLESNPNYAKVGFNLKNRQPWVYDLEINAKYNKFIVIKPRRMPFLDNNIEYTPSDIVVNFFIAKTDVLKKIPWDNELKTCEHEDHCYRLKQAGYKTFYTDVIDAEYINDKPDEYKVMRNRLYTEFKNILKKKYNLDPDGSWLCYNAKLPKGDQV